MHVYFCGISGTAIGPLALIAKQAGFDVSGSDKQGSSYITYLRSKGIDNITIGQSTDSIAKVHQKRPIDWLVYSSAVPIESPNHPELIFAEKNGIRSSKRDEFLNMLLEKTNQKLIAVAGTHGKTTTTAMCIWMFQQLGIPVSYSVGAKLPFGDMGRYDVQADCFIYEADEYDRNFLAFSPAVSIITGIDWDHPDIYPTRSEYYQAFVEFIDKSGQVIAHQVDLDKIGLRANSSVHTPRTEIRGYPLELTGEVNRQNARLILETAFELVDASLEDLVAKINKFPGVSRRFENIAENVYSDYAHTPDKIRGALQTAREVAGDDVVVVYEGLHNTRQHFIRNDLVDLFDGVKKLYIVPSYLAREDPSLQILTPSDISNITERPEDRQPIQLGKQLAERIHLHATNGNLVLCLSAGGGGSLDEWLRATFKT